MIGNDDNQEEVTFKVADRRKFNADGSLREGVELDPPKPAKTEEPPAATPPPAEAAVEPEAAPEATFMPEEPGDAGESVEEYDEDDDLDVPGAEDPASFVNFLSTLATNAAAALGAMPHPATGQRSLDLETGKYWLDVMAMIKERTKGNLHEKELRLLDGILGDLRMQYVNLVRATEEKLKQQAAERFSSGDILGKS